MLIEQFGGKMTFSMNKNKVLIVGASGMAGHMIYYYLKEQEKYDLYTSVFRNKLNNESIICDVRKESDLIRMIKSIKPNFIINAVGALIKESKSCPSNAILLNSWFPHILSKISKEHNAKLIHISTDCVFSGKQGNYSVDDFRDADDVYGRSKALGELINDENVTIRTSVIGPELKKDGEGLLHWFLNQEGEINGYANVFWSGVTTLELAKFINKIIKKFIPGIYQLSSEEKISKYELLRLLNDQFNKNIVINPQKEKIVDKSLKTYYGVYDYKVPSYKDMIQELTIMMKNIAQYSHYNLKMR